MKKKRTYGIKKKRKTKVHPYTCTYIYNSCAWLRQQLRNIHQRVALVPRARAKEIGGRFRHVLCIQHTPKSSLYPVDVVYRIEGI